MTDLKKLSIIELRSLMDSIIYELGTRSNMRTAAVIDKYGKVCLFITHMPKNISLEKLTDLLLRAKFCQRKYLAKQRIVIGLKNENDIIKQQFFTGMYHSLAIERISYDKLNWMASEYDRMN